MLNFKNFVIERKEQEQYQTSPTWHRHRGRKKIRPRRTAWQQNQYQIDRLQRGFISQKQTRKPAKTWKPPTTITL